MAIKHLITNRPTVAQLFPAALQVAFFVTITALVAAHGEG